MSQNDQIVTQIGLLLTQMRYSRSALEHIEQATAKYAGIALKVSGEAGPLGAPPLFEGALKVHIVNINDLTNSGAGIGGAIATTLGGVGRFIASIPGAFISSAVTGLLAPGLFADIRRIVEGVDRILDKIGKSPPDGKPKPTILEQFESITELLLAAAAAFDAASGKVAVAGPAGPDGPAPAAVSSTSTWLELVRAIGGVVEGLNSALPILTGALASLVTRLDDIKLAVLDVLTFALRNVLLLYDTLVVIVGNSLSLAGDLIVSIIEILARTIDTLLGSARLVIAQSLKAALLAFDILGTALRNTVDPLQDWLADGLGGALEFLGNLKIFRIVAHLANVLPLILPAIATILDKKLDRDTELKPLQKAAQLDPLSGEHRLNRRPTHLPLRWSGLDRSEELINQGNVLADTAGKEWSTDKDALTDAGSKIVSVSRAAVARHQKSLSASLEGIAGRARDRAGAVRVAEAAATPRPKTALDEIAGAYEDWLVKHGGLMSIVGAVEKHFANPADSAVVRAVLGDVARKAGAGIDAVVVDIREVTIDLVAAPPAPVVVSANDPVPDLDALASLMRSNDERLGIVAV